VKQIIKKSSLVLVGLLLIGLLGTPMVQAATNFTSSAADADGNIYLASNALQDVFYYNTWLDSDEGAWRKDLNAQETSWYDEKIKPTRGDQDEFPRHAYLILTDTSLEIIDAEQQKLWMRFEEGSDNMLPDGDHYAVWAVNGSVYVASSTRLSIINFVTDSAGYINATDDYTTTSTIASRNDEVSWTAGSGEPIANNACRDVSVALIGSIPFIAVATDAGVSVINSLTGTVHDYYDVATTDDTVSVMLLSDGTLYYTNATDGDLEIFYTVQNDAGDQSTPDYNYNAASIPALLADPDATRYGLYATAGTSWIDATRNTLYVGSASGVSVIQENTIGQESTGSVKFFTKDYITEEMIGDIRGMWTLEEDAGDFLDKSGKGNDLTDGTTVTRNVSAVRGEGITFTAASSQYLSRAYDADFDFGTGSFSVSGWIRHPDTSGGQVMLIDRTDANTIGFQLYIDSDGNLVGRISDNGTDWDSVTGSEAIDTDTWEQFAFSWEAGTALRLFVNGIEVSSDATLVTAASISGTTPVLEIGRDNGGGAYWNGEVDEIMITAEALTAQQVWDMYQKGNAARTSTYVNYADGSSSISKGLGTTSDGRVMFIGTNDGAAGGALSVIKIGETGDYASSVARDVLNADSTFISYTTGSTPSIVSNDITSLSMGRAQQREFLVVGTAASGATGLITGYNWYSASDSYIHGGVMDAGGKCIASESFEICDSFGQVFAGDPLIGTNYTIDPGYEYDDRDAPDGPVLIISSPTIETNPHWQWENTWDRSGVEGYYMRIGTTEEGEEFMPARWLGFINHWDQDIAFQYAGTYYAQLKVRDKVGNEGNWGPVAELVVQPSLMFIIEGVEAGTANLGSGLTDKETTDLSTFSQVVSFGTLPVNEPVIAAQKLIVRMNVGEGYVVTGRHDRTMWTARNDEEVISAFNAQNDFPVYWSSAPLGHIGYHTDDATLNNDGNGPDRFRGTANKYAGFAAEAQEVMYSDTLAVNDENYVVYKIQISPTLLPGTYTNTITYVCTATY